MYLKSDFYGETNASRAADEREKQQRLDEEDGERHASILRAEALECAAHDAIDARLVTPFAAAQTWARTLGMTEVA